MTRLPFEVVESGPPPTPAPPMTRPVLIGAMSMGCLIGALVLLVDTVAPGQIAAIAGFVDPAAAVLVGTTHLPLGLLTVSVAMNAVFYGLLAMIALVAMTLAGVRSTFERHHWLMLGGLMSALMVTARIAIFH